MLSHAEKDHTLFRRSIINNLLIKPEEFGQSAANVRLVWPLISRVSGRDGRDDITGVDHESLPVLSFMVGSLAFSSSALAHCGLTDLALDQAISQENELRRSGRRV